MKDYLKFNAADFAQNDRFLKWVKYPGHFPEIDIFWEGWLNRHAEKKDEIEEAIKMVKILTEEPQSCESNKQEEIWAKLQRSIELERVKPFFGRGSAPFKIAAAIFVLLCSSVTVWWIHGKGSKSSYFFTAAKTDFEEEKKEGKKLKTVLLSDGSSVILQPNSSLPYPVNFNTTSREVTLRGEAFFELAKNPKKPFIVYTDKFGAKVTGTSFIIRAHEDDSDILI